MYIFEIIVCLCFMTIVSMKKIFVRRLRNIM